MGHEVKCSTEHLPVFTYSSFQSSPTRPQSPTHPRCPFMRSVASGLTSRLKQQRYLHFRSLHFRYLHFLSEPPARAGASGSAPASNDGRVDGPPRPAGEEGAGSNGGGSGARPPGADVHVVVFQEKLSNISPSLCAPSLEGNTFRNSSRSIHHQIELAVFLF